jgi:hypothetical protein
LETDPRIGHWQVVGMGKLYFILFWGGSISVWLILYQTCVWHHFLPIDSPQINIGIERAPVIDWFPWIHLLLSLMLPFGLDLPPFPYQQLWHWVRQLALNGCGMRQKCHFHSNLGPWMSVALVFEVMSMCKLRTFSQGKFVKFSMGRKTNFELWTRLWCVVKHVN